MTQGTGVLARIDDQSGVTLIELLMAMVVGVIVIGGGIWGMARAFSVTNASTARVTANSSAEVGLERMVVDLRDVVNGSCAYNGAAISGVVVGLAGSITTVQMCDPNTNVAGTGNAPPVEGVQWQCNTATSGITPPAETCIRSVDTGTKAQPVVSTSNRISGVQAVNLRGIVNSGAAAYLPCGNTTACTASQTVNYTLAPGTATSLSWVGLIAGIGQNLAAGSGVIRTVSGTTPFTIQTGAALQNFGTS